VGLNPQNAFDVSHRVPAQPDRAVILEADFDSTIAANARTLSGDIGVAGNQALTSYQGCHAAVAAAAHRVFGHASAWLSGAICSNSLERQS